MNIETTPKMSRSVERILKLFNEEASSIRSAKLIQSSKFTSELERLSSLVIRGDVVIQSSSVVCLVNDLRTEDRWCLNVWE